MSDPILTQITMFGCTFAPRDWVYCAGQLLAIEDFQAVYALVGTTYGGDGRVTFGVPDLRGRVPIGIGKGPGLSERFQGQLGGSEKASLFVNDLPAHSHSAAAVAVSTGTLGGAPNVSTSVRCNNTGSDTNQPAGKVWGKGGREKTYADDVSGQDEMHPGMVNVSVDMSPVSVDVQTMVGPVTVDMTGGNFPHENMGPFLVMPYCMAVEGQFPRRP